MSAFISFMREYLDPVAIADQCAQNVDDIDTLVNNATDLTRNIRAVFNCILQTGLKLTTKKQVCWLQLPQTMGMLELDKLNSLAKPTQQKEFHHKLQNSKPFFSKHGLPKSKRHFSGTCNSWNIKKKIPGWLRRLTHSTGCSKRECQSINHDTWKKTFHLLNEALNDAC